MADNKERIWIEYEKKPLKGATYSTTCLVTTHTEAVEKMARRLEYEGINKFECHTIAEWCLDTLLGVEK